MEKLKRIVEEELVTATDPQAQILILQKINALLLTDYEIRIGDDTIKPLWVEAYYRHEPSFMDDNTHGAKNQKGADRFGKLYFHEKGWGGVDVCLSCGDYYLSFLIKYARVNGAFKSQTGIYDYLLKKYGKAYAQSLEVLKRIPEEEKDCETVFTSIRKGLTKESFKYEKLAALTGIRNKEHKFVYPTGFGKEKIVAEYIKTHSCEETFTLWQELLGWIPGKVRKRLQ